MIKNQGSLRSVTSLVAAKADVLRLSNELRMLVSPQLLPGHLVTSQHLHAALKIVSDYTYELRAQAAGGFVGTSRELNAFAEGCTVESCLRNTIDAHACIVALHLAKQLPIPPATASGTGRGIRVVARLTEEEYELVRHHADAFCQGDIGRALREVIVAAFLPPG